MVRMQGYQYFIIGIIKSCNSDTNSNSSGGIKSSSTCGPSDTF